MKYYVVAEISITDPSWAPAYIENVTKLVEQHGGRYLARTSKINKLEGERNTPQLFVIVEWPSEDAAKAFYKSDAYRPYLQSRVAGSNSELFLIAGEDMTGAAKIID